MKTFQRSDRVGHQIQTCIAELLQKKIKDPRLESATITGVKMTQDLREAYIYFTTYTGKKGQNDALKGFKSASPFLRRALAGKLGLRYMPSIKFFHDDSFDYGSRIDSVLKSIKDEDNES